MSEIEDFIKAYKQIPFNYMLLEVNETDKWCISNGSIHWEPLDEEYEDWNYSGDITEGEQRYSGWLMVNVDTYTGTWQTMLFKIENEVRLED